jgi:hypothetical protein
LHELDIASCDNITDDGVVAVAEGNWHNLQTLKVSGCSIHSDLTLKALANGNLSQLRELCIDEAYDVTDSGLAYLASGNLKNLVTLSIGGGDDFTGVGLGAIARGMPSLLGLSVEETTLTDADEGLTAIFTHLVNLKTLLLNECDATDAGFEALTRSEVIRGEIKYALCTLGIRSRGITDNGIKSIANGLTNLKHLDIRDTRVTDIGLAALASSGLQLTFLGLIDSTMITERGIIQVMTEMPTLKSLKISNTDIDDNNACAIAKSCGSSSVRTLEMCGHALTDIGLMA